MRKISLIALLFAGLFVFGASSSAKAQTQLNNSGFETWKDVGISTEEPAQWNSFKSASGDAFLLTFAQQQIKRSTLTRPGSTGNYSCLIWSRTILSVVANGNVTTGQINMGSATATDPANYNISRTADTTYSEALNAHPDSLVFWTKFKPSNTAGSDSGRVRALIHDNYDAKDPLDAASQPHVVGDATLNFPSTNNQWVRISIPFNYTGTATSPDYMLITFTTNKTPGGGSGGDSLYIDDLSLVYNGSSSTINTNIDPSENFFVYTDDNDIIIDLSFNQLRTSKIEMYNMSGQLVYKTQITAQSVQHFVGINQFKSGIYVITANTDDGRKFSQKVFIK
ncbi:MAG TPA: T9SS type A sorting domain-containing protein [Bacteroidales bacterium]|nr:T9SS type A sorting domain-containing protein [Bacteroidales bacterium]